MKVSALSFAAAQLVAVRAFVVRPPQATRRLARSRDSVSLAAWTLETAEGKDIDLEDVTAEIDAVLLVTEEALIAEANGQEFPFKSTELYDNIEDSLVRAYELVEYLQRERQEFEAMLEEEKEDPNLRMDADSILGDKQASEVLQLLSQGAMNATSFQTFVQQQKYATRIARYERLEQARSVVQEKEEEARLLQEEIVRAEVVRLNEEKKANTVAAAFDGSLLGCVLGLVAWYAFPEYLGDNVFPAVPAALAGGLMGCACVVAFTADTPVASFMKKARFGCIGRAVLPLIAKLWSGVVAAVRAVIEAILAVPIGIVNATVATVQAIWDAIVSSILTLYYEINRIQNEFIADVEERSRAARRRKRRDDYW